MRLFDIKYKNETIIYELGLDEALAHCACPRRVRSDVADAGSDPVQANVGCASRLSLATAEPSRPRHVLRLRLDLEKMRSLTG